MELLIGIVTKEKKWSLIYTRNKTCNLTTEFFYKGLEFVLSKTLLPRASTVSSWIKLLPVMPVSNRCISSSPHCFTSSPVTC